MAEIEVLAFAGGAVATVTVSLANPGDKGDAGVTETHADLPVLKNGLAVALTWAVRFDYRSGEPLAVSTCVPARFSLGRYQDEA